MARTNATRTRWSTLLKIGVTIVGLLIIVLGFDLAKIVDTLRQASWEWAAIGFLLVNLSLFVRAFRWWVLLQGLGTAVRFGRLAELYFVGNFYNTFLPSGFGGDVVRVLEVAQDVDSGVAAGTVLVDRLTGLMTLFIMALVTLPLRPATFPAELLWVITAVCGLGLVAGLIVLQGGLALRVMAWLPRQLERYVENFIQPILTTVRHCGWAAIIKAIAVSAVFNFVMVGWWAAAGRALGFEITFTYLLIVIPILSITLLVPSIGGIGVREPIASLLFTGAGLSPAEATALAFLVTIVERLSGLVGAPVYLASLFRKKASTSE